jgi:hypothetical protein
MEGASAQLGPEAAQRLEDALRTAMRAETEIEIRNSPRPMFAEMSGAAEG